MKLRITRKELEELTLEQRQNLCDLWIPHIYDTVVANVCVDAAEEKYEQIIYVIGGIKLLKHNDMLLYDLKFMADETVKIKEDDDSFSGGIEADRIEGTDAAEASGDSSEEEPEEEFSFDEDFNFEFQRPEAYIKQDCLPLLDIGQMVDILERKNFGEGDFYLSAAIGDYVLEMGKNNISGSTSYDQNNKEIELCDILWESVKATL
ncbi:hypothetical protein CLHUN_38750 [Ruminiclostridium hungatei]|uniref:Uncharacterized protein n=1 Tax=Ruminiclostridium hungatei TaxID=48256 RepID=A0A1V4SFI2_RUMHU|nr:hypothetical protein [Ruminiclostridium hungatei]OPX42225.1 hypothetical protein CLHUN_38750 [Ruminiclostridium hungatei]